MQAPGCKAWGHRHRPPRRLPQLHSRGWHRQYPGRNALTVTVQFHVPGRATCKVDLEHKFREKEVQSCLVSLGGSWIWLLSS